MIKENSILNSIPTELPRRDVFLLEGIRYASSIIDISYKKLFNELNTASTIEVLRPETYYIIFKEAWSIIDFGWKLRSLLMQIGTKTEDRIGDKKKVLDIKFLESLKDFRNTFQHLDERIDEVIVNKNAYVWGNLSWLHIIDSERLNSCAVSPGHPRSSVSIINPSGLSIKPPICHITLDSVNKKKEKIKVNLSELVEKINHLITQFEIVIKEQLDLLNNESKFAQDMIIKIRLTTQKH